MEPNQDPRAHEPPGGPPPPVGDLVVQDGRANETRRPLTAPLTLIGRAKGCHVRANVNGVSPFHCAVFSSPAGLILRDLTGKSGTRVNGTPTATATLRDGDEIAVGPCRFRLHLPAGARAPADAALPEDVLKEREALRIQAAAVAAQQAALFDEEARLHQRRAALDQQEKELAAHLEDKRQRLLELRAQVREAHDAMRAERVVYERRIAEMAGRMEAERREVEEGRRQTRDERRRLLGLRGRMKRRWHRFWSAEREAMRQRERALEERRRDLERQAEELTQARFRFHSETEPRRRELQEKWDNLRREQGQWEESCRQEQADLTGRAGQLDQREADLARREAALEDERRRFEARRSGLEKEIQGLENRVAHGRQKLQEVEREAARLVPAPQSSPSPLDDVAATPVEIDPPPPGLAGGLAGWIALSGDDADSAGDEAADTERRSRLEAVAQDLADQRLHLLEHWRRLLRTHRQWQQEREEATADLEDAGRRLREREQAVVQVEERWRQRMEEAARTRRHLEARHAQLKAHAAVWAAERDRLKVDLQSRQEHLAQRLTLLDGLRKAWHRRGRQAVADLRDEYARCERVRQEFSLLRRQWLQRTEALADAERKLARQALAVERYRHKYLGATAEAGERAEALHRRLESLFARAEADLARQRQAAAGELIRLEERYRQVQRGLDKNAAREAELADREAAWEQRRAMLEAEAARLRREAQAHQAKRELFEREVAELREEVERLVRQLLDTHDAGQPGLGQAA